MHSPHGLLVSKCALAMLYSELVPVSPPLRSARWRGPYTQCRGPEESLSSMMNKVTGYSFPLAGSM